MSDRQAVAREWVVAAAPGAVPLLGHLPRLRKDPFGYLASLPAYGDLVEIKIGTWRALVVCHPDLVSTVLLDDRTYDKGGAIFDAARETVGNGVASCPHSDHRRQRRLLQPAFHSEMLPHYAQMMTEQIGALLATWRDGQLIDVPDQMRRLAGAVLMHTLLPDIGRDAVDAVTAGLNEVTSRVLRRVLTPGKVLQNAPIPANRRFQRVRQAMYAAIDQSIAEHRRHDAHRTGLLSVLTAYQDERGDRFTDTEIREQVITLLIGGIETMATTLTWALHELSINPGLQHRVHAEADTVLGNRAATWTDLPHLGLTSRVLTETLRLYPPLWILTRTVTRPTRLAGCPLEPGTTILYMSYILHRRPDHFPQPHRFDPERWNPAHTAPPPRNASIPFGTGARKCIGDIFATTETPLILASICAQWTLTPHTDNVQPALKATLQPKQLILQLQGCR